MKAGDNDIGLFQGYKTILEKAMEEGFKSGNLATGQGTLLLEQLKINASVFSAFKQHNQIADMAAALVDDQGKLRSFSAFKKAVAPITQKYSNNWLRAEYNHAVGSARMASQWQTYVEKGGMLAYYTIGDGRVREEHQVLNGTVLPVTDPFWDTYYPPNGWNCRCYVRWAGHDATPMKPNNLPELKPMFKGNVGKGYNPFSISELIQRVSLNDRTRIEEMLGKIDEGRPLIELYQQDPNIRLMHKYDSGGYVFEHINYDTADYQDNMAAAQSIAEKSKNIILIREHFSDNKVLDKLKDEGWMHRNAELSINGAIADLKTLRVYKGKTPTSTTFKNTTLNGIKDNKLKEVVVDISSMISSLGLDDEIKMIFRRRSISGIHLIRNNVYVYIRRFDYENNFTSNLINKLF